MSRVQDLLTQYADYIDQRTVLECNQRDLEAKVITPEIQAKLDEIKLEFAPAFDAVDAKIAEVQEAIREATLLSQVSDKTDRFMAVYAGGRTSWDSKGLNGYAVAHPEILAFRTVGAPSVTIRRK